MDWTSYLFVFYIFVLAAAMVFIWTKASRGKLDERIRLLEDKQRELIVLQNDTKEAMMVFDTYSYEAKENLEKEREKIEFLIARFEEMLENHDDLVLESTIKAEPRAVVDLSKDYTEKKELVIDDGKSGGDLYEQITKLTKKGYTIDEIVKKLGISKGEANFILGISK